MDTYQTNLSGQLFNQYHHFWTRILKSEYPNIGWSDFCKITWELGRKKLPKNWGGKNNLRTGARKITWELVREKLPENWGAKITWELGARKIT
jgi:hypothetical protein